MKNNFLKFGLITFFALFYALPLLAGPGDAPGDEEDDPQVPIDNWILSLVLIGIAIGIYFIMKYRKKQIA